MSPAALRIGERQLGVDHHTELGGGDGGCSCRAQLDRPVRETPVGEQFGSLVDVETTHVDACDGGVSRCRHQELVVEDPAATTAATTATTARRALRIAWRPYCDTP